MSEDTIVTTCTELVDGTSVRPGLTPEQRTLRAQIAAETSWTNTVDRAARTAPAREARFQLYIERARELHEGHDVSEEFILDVAERLRRIDMQKMALASAKARRQKTLARKRAAAEVRGDGG